MRRLLERAQHWLWSPAEPLTLALLAAILFRYPQHDPSGVPREMDVAFALARRILARVKED
jgi:hypothetical protein